ncbi:protein of unknown function [Moritella yayanosii]|uniref:Uncharacterized protein n=1 Tax=Moritella yayanosii TaxID=69539 RepID=A0A330LNZ7_9GAMM|nr:protein of unknown function [Moritella yayanosii]
MQKNQFAKGAKKIVVCNYSAGHEMFEKNVRLSRTNYSRIN